MSKSSIGGSLYETVGNSSSMLLLKCNGTARIQWGSKLIDLIKNGKIASEGGEDLIYIVDSDSDVHNDGIYIVKGDSEESPQILVSKNGKTYNLAGSDIFISASNKQDITIDQQKQALENIGMYYNTLEDVQKAGIQDGLVYVLSDKSLYTIKDGTINEFEAKVKTVTVQSSESEGNVINDQIKINLQIGSQDYIILAENRIVIKQPVFISNSVQFGSENADKNKGYRFYMEKGLSFLDVDKINVRGGIDIKTHTEITAQEFKQLMDSNKLEAHQWYLITDYQNPWRIPANSTKFNRPILVRALTGNSLYQEGYLYQNQSILIKYNPNYVFPINVLLQDDSVSEETTPEESEESSDPDLGVVNAKGYITWMKDEYGNEASFDFLDYCGYDNVALTTLHKYNINDQNTLSVFPTGSYNNKITVNNVYGTVFNNGALQAEGSSIIKFDVNAAKEIALSSSIEGNKITISLNNYNEGCSKLQFTINTSEHLEIVKSVGDNQVVNFTGISLINAYKDLYSLTCVDQAEGLQITIQKSDTNTSAKIEEEEFLTIEFNILNTEETNYFINLDNIALFDYNYNARYLDKHYISLKWKENNLVIESTSSEEGITSDEHTSKIMCDNIINCVGNFELGITCDEFRKNTINAASGVVIHSNMVNVTLEQVYDCTFSEGTVCNTTCRDLLQSLNFNNTDFPILYDTSKVKTLYFENGILKEAITQSQTFTRGMIVMHAPNIPIPYGWAICDGNTYTFEGSSVKTPNLVGKFIKAANSDTDGIEGGSNNISINKVNLPVQTKIYDLYESSEGVSVYTSSETPGEAISVEPSYYSLIFIMKL